MEKMNSKERVLAAINHRQSDKVPIDIGAAHNTGISVCALMRLRDALGLPKKDIPIYETMQMLGEVDDDVRRVLGGDVIGLNNKYDFLGVPFDGDNQLFIMPDGTRTLINSKHKVRSEQDGRTYLYPQGNDSFGASVLMPKGGYFFDNIDRSPPFDEDHLSPIKDYEDSFPVMDDDEARYYETQAKRLATETEYAVLGVFGRGSLGDPSILPGASSLNPQGIRRYEDWIMAQLLYPEYIHEVFKMHTQSAIRNLEIYRQAVGDKIQIVVISGTDFGTQGGPIMSINTFRDLYKPYYKKMNDWVHQNTNWKTFYHSCGAIADYLDDFVEMGVDIINPVQLSANGMDGLMLKEKYGDRIVFWGGGVNTQKTLAGRSLDEIEKEVKERLDVFSPGGGYVFATIHNIVGNVPAENIKTVFKTAKEYQLKEF